MVVDCIVDMLHELTAQVSRKKLNCYGFPDKREENFAFFPFSFFYIMTSVNGGDAEPWLLTAIIVKFTSLGAVLAGFGSKLLFLRQVLTKCCRMSHYHCQPFVVELGIKKTFPCFAATELLQEVSLLGITHRLYFLRV